ncbi:MAG: nicotinamide mononucleotide transporter, partial [Bacteroidales bacterium]|nr:nicotinamide mononucleotide transporter [Bacteroidales bacterium]
MDWINYTLFTLGNDYPVLLIDLIASVLGLTCVFLAGRNSKYNFWVGYVYNIFLFILFWRQHLYSAMLLQPVSFAINAFGHWRWTHPRQGEESARDKTALKVTQLKWEERGLALAGTVIIAFFWGWILNRLFPADPH